MPRGLYKGVGIVLPMVNVSACWMARNIFITAAGHSPAMGEEEGGQQAPEGLERYRTEAREVMGPEAEAQMWDLDLEGRIRKLTWWWWWWLFLLKDPQNPRRTRQLMILWSTKHTKWIKVNDYLWEPARDVERIQDGDRTRLSFDGMTAAWWYDGSRMHEPLLLERGDFEVVGEGGEGGEGTLDPRSPHDLRLSGRPGRYRLDISLPEKGHAFHLEMVPWTPFMDQHRYRANRYTRKWSYNILRVYGSRVTGRYLVDGQEVDAAGSTAYFQKVRVNAPAVPWYWCVLHTERGDYLDYFMPHVGLTILRGTDRPRSWLDRDGHFMGRSLQFWDGAEQRLRKFKRTRIRKTFTGDDLPVFHLRGENEHGTIELELEAYSRAYWRFEQKYLLGLGRSILYYNEYPAQVNRFELVQDGKRTSLADLGWTAANCEHTWGKLL